MANGLELLAVAQSQVGTKESPAGSNRQKYGAWYGMNGVAWCDIFVSWCANQIGASNVIGKYAYCPYHVNYFKSRGWWLSAEAKPQPGDIIFFASHGTACHVGIVKARNGSYSVTTIEGNTSVSSNDNGGRVMQRVRTYGNPYGSWGILGFARPNYSGASGTVSQPAQASRNYLKRGDTGSNVKTLQQKLINLGYSCGRSGADGEFGTDTEKAVRSFQQHYGLEVDGVAGVNTIAKLNALASGKTTTTNRGHYNEWVARLQRECNKQGFSRQTVDGVAGLNTLAGCPTVRLGARGNITRLIQEAVGVSADGVFGRNTKAAVMHYQRAHGLAADGIVGKNTWKKLLGL
ncbi:MAG: peptidoglycan-binding protein [Pseudoramibacter sp.]